MNKLYILAGIIIFAISFGFLCGYLYSYTLAVSDISSQCNAYVQANCKQPQELQYPWLTWSENGTE